MQDFNPTFSNLNGPFSNTSQKGEYSALNGVVFYNLQVNLELNFSIEEGPYLVTLPVAPKYDAILRDGAIFYNGGALMALSLLLKAGEKEAFLSYPGANGEDAPLMSTIPSVIVPFDTYFYSSGSYFSNKLD